LSFVVRVSQTVRSPIEAVFERLANHDTWPDWMPRSFRVLGPGLGRLAPGARPRVWIRGVPFPVRVRIYAVEAPQLLAWYGGSVGLRADHRFELLSLAEAGTEIISEETWSGPLAGLLRWAVEPNAKRVCGEQVAGLARAVTGGRAP
jgi:hypothetical protein